MNASDCGEQSPVVEGVVVVMVVVVVLVVEVPPPHPSLHANPLSVVEARARRAKVAAENGLQHSPLAHRHPIRGLHMLAPFNLEKMGPVRLTASRSFLRHVCMLSVGERKEQNMPIVLPLHVSLLQSRSRAHPWFSGNV